MSLAKFRFICYNLVDIFLFILLLMSFVMLLKDVTARESGYYHCISRKLNGDGYTVGQVDMIVSGSTLTSIDAVKIIAIVLSIIVIIGCAVLYYKMRKDWKRYEGRGVIPGEKQKYCLFQFWLVSHTFSVYLYSVY